MSDLIDRQALGNWLRTECYGTDTYDDKEYVIGRFVLFCKKWCDSNGEPHMVITLDSFTIVPSEHVIAWMPIEPPKEDMDGERREG